MKILLLVAITSLLSIKLFATTFRNGDFEKGMNDWEGEGRVIKDSVDDNKILLIRPSKDEQHVQQIFELPKGTKQVVVTYRIKLDGYKPKNATGNGFRFVWLNTKGGSFWGNPKLPEDGQWKTIKTSRKIKAGSKKLGIRLSVKRGTGKVYFDDVIIKFE